MMFGGLDICSLEAVVAKDDKEYIIEVNDCATTLLGESQEDDRKHIAELVLKTMEVLIIARDVVCFYINVRYVFMLTGETKGDCNP